MRQQLCDTTGRLRWQSLEDVLQVRVWFMAIEARGLCRPPNYAEGTRFSPDLPVDPFGIV